MPSWIWTAFQKGEDKNANCLNCEQVLKRKDTSTKTMWSHLRSKHPDVFMKLKKTQAETPFRKISSSPTSKPKPKIVQKEKRKSPTSRLASVEELKLPNVPVETPTNQPMAFPPQSNDDEQQVQINDSVRQMCIKLIQIQHQALLINTLENRIVNILVRNNLPYNFIEDPDFEFMVSSICPGYMPKSSPTLALKLQAHVMNVEEEVTMHVE